MQCCCSPLRGSLLSWALPAVQTEGFPVRERGTPPLPAAGHRHRVLPLDGRGEQVRTAWHALSSHPTCRASRHAALRTSPLLTLQWCALLAYQDHVSKPQTAACSRLARCLGPLPLQALTMRPPCRDIKLENALLDKSQRILKLTDFGYAKRDQDSLCHSQVGTPNYAAPEVIGNAQRSYSGKKADTWSCGVLLYVLLFHRYPFERPDDPAGGDGFAKVRALSCAAPRLGSNALRSGAASAGCGRCEKALWSSACAHPACQMQGLTGRAERVFAGREKGPFRLSVGST